MYENRNGTEDDASLSTKLGHNLTVLAHLNSCLKLETLNQVDNIARNIVDIVHAIIFTQEKTNKSIVVHLQFGASHMYPSWFSFLGNYFK